MTASSPVAAQPVEGTYNVTAYITGFTPTAGTNFCFPNVEFAYGLVSSFYITYHGPGKTAEASIPVPFVPKSGSHPAAGPLVALLTLPPTPTGANTGWTGMFTEVLQPGGLTFPAAGFAATLVETGGYSFGGTMTLDTFVSGGVNSCSISFQYEAIITSPP
jgi:hypothetical protein